MSLICEFVGCCVLGQAIPKSSNVLIEMKRNSSNSRHSLAILSLKSHSYIHESFINDMIDIHISEIPTSQCNVISYYLKKIYFWILQYHISMCY